jgi:hypothetical protein
MAVSVEFIVLKCQTTLVAAEDVPSRYCRPTLARLAPREHSDSGDAGKAASRGAATPRRGSEMSPLRGWRSNWNGLPNADALGYIDVAAPRLGAVCGPSEMASSEADDGAVEA